MLCIPGKGDAMNIPWAGTGFKPPKIKQYILSVHTAVLKGIAVFFSFDIFPANPYKSTNMHHHF